MALILSNEAGKSLKEWEPISERIIFARFESKCQNATIIQVYAPTNDGVSRQAFGDNKTGIQFTLLQKLEDLDFADDMVLLSQKITHMKQKFAVLVEQAASVGLKINASKTKEMRIRSPANTGNINCVGEVLEQVLAFTYLGSLILPPQAVLRKILRPGAGRYRLHFPF